MKIFDFRDDLIRDYQSYIRGQMARRPNVFSQEDFQASLRRQGCPESLVFPITSDYRLFVPLLVRELGEERLFAIADHAKDELGLGDQKEFWQVAAKYIVGWSEEQINDYKLHR